MISIIVNFHNNRREAPNTLYSMSRQYQHGAEGIDYEVIAIDHGSSQPLDPEMVRSFGPQFHYRRVDTKDVSPVKAINEICRIARGQHLVVVMDGAHILSPAILVWMQAAFGLFRWPFAVTPALHLGPKLQNDSALEGYNQQVEDELLAKSNWRDDGYRLYSIASVTAGFADQAGGWFGWPFESNCYGITKEFYFGIGAMDERFVSPGGGLANLDLFRRAIENESTNYVTLVGEATFHQIHGGISTNVRRDQHPLEFFKREYESIRGKKLDRVLRTPYLLGGMPPLAIEAIQASAREGLQFWAEHAPNG